MLGAQNGTGSLGDWWIYMEIVGPGNCISRDGRKMAEIGIGESLRGVADVISMSILIASGHLQDLGPITLLSYKNFINA